jgi:hypothetical protein
MTSKSVATTTTTRQKLARSLSLSLSLSPIWLGLFKTEKEENHKKTPKKKKPNQI